MLLYVIFVMPGVFSWTQLQLHLVGKKMENMFMFPHHSDQMSQRWKVSKIALLKVFSKCICHCLCLCLFVGQIRVSRIRSDSDLFLILRRVHQCNPLRACADRERHYNMSSFLYLTGRVKSCKEKAQWGLAACPGKSGPASSELLRTRE